MRHLFGLVTVVVVGALGACSDGGGPKDAPDTVLDSSPKMLTNETKVMFTFHATSNANGFVCRVDGGAASPCVSGFETTVGDGMHTFEVAASLNNLIDDSPAMATWKVDATAPDTQLVMGPPSLDNTVNPQITFTGSDPGGGAVTFECKLDTGAFAPCMAPDTVNVTDGAHSFVVRAVDAAGNVDPTPAMHDWTVDTSFPDTTITLGPTGGSTTQPNVSFTFGSPASGVTFECSIDGGAFTTCTSPQAFTGLTDGMHTFTVRAKNAAGNVDPTPATRAWTVDGTAPDVAITAKPTNPSNDSTPSFSFVSSDGTATFECAVDGGAFMACTSGFTSAALADGSHMFQVRAKDPTGNVSAAQSYTWTIDTMAPTVTITSGPSGMVASANATFAFTTAGAPTVVECALDGGTFGACASPKAYTALPDGMHTFVVRVADLAGNTGMDMRMFTVDTTPPTVTITSAPSNPTNDSTPTFMFMTAGSPTAIECSVDGGAFAACTSPFTTSTLADGSHTFVVRATDMVGNSASDMRTFVVDTTAPTVTIVTKPTNPTNSSAANFTFTVSEGTPMCSLDGAAFTNCTSPKSYAGLADGAHTFTVRAADALGNTGMASYAWTIDTMPPVVTINSHPNALTNQTTATFTFTVSEGSPECSIDGSLFAACTSGINYPGLTDGPHTFIVRSADALGNSATAMWGWTVDATAPVVTITAKPTNPSNSASASFSFTVSDGAVECKVDSAAFATCSSPMMYTSLIDGSHTFTVRSTDTAGNVGSATYTWTVDTMAPTVVITPASKPALNSNVATANFVFTVSDGTIQCKHDVGAVMGTFGACTSATTMNYAGLAEGSHTFTVRSTDTAGNVGSDTYTWTVDTIAPTVTITPASKPANPTMSTSASFVFTVSDGTIQCRHDVGAVLGTFGACTSATTMNYAGLAQGSHTFTVRSTDTAGNIGSDTYTWTVDTTAPTVVITPASKPANPSNVATANFVFTVSDGTIQCKHDVGAVMGTFGACTSATTMNYAGLAEGSHTFTVRSTDTAGNVGSDTYTWTVDTIAPTVTITPASKPANPTMSTSASFVFTVSDGTIQCRHDVGAVLGTFGACTSATTMNYAGLAQGSHTFTVRSTDTAGNVGSDTYTWTVDTTAPTVVITPASKPANPSNVATANFVFTVSDGTIQCKHDVGAVMGTFGACTSATTMNYAGLAEGSHTFTVRSTDTAGNVGSDTYTWTVDTIAPTVVITAASKPPLNSNSASASFVFTVSDGTIQCRHDVGAVLGTFGACTSSTTMNYAGLAQGSHTFTVRSTDTAGNVGSDTYTWTVDTVAPTVTITPASKPAANSPVATANFVFTVSDGTIQCKHDVGAVMGTFGACTSATTMNYAGLAEGSHTFTVRSTDLAGNVGSDTYTWNVDTIAPMPSITSGPAASSPSSSANFVFSTNEGALTCSLDGALFTSCSSPKAYTMLGDGAHTFVVKATDLAGNFGTASYPWTIDTTGPVITFSSVPPARWPVNYYDFTWSANETATYECSNNNGASWVACTTPFTIPNLAVMFGPAIYNQNNTFSVRGKDSLNNVGAAVTHNWAPADGLVLHYAFEQGSRRNSSLLAQRPTYSPDIASNGTTVVGGWAGTALRDTAAATYVGTVRPLTSSQQGIYTGGMWVRLNNGNANGTLWSNISTSGLWGHSVTVAGSTLTLTLRQNGSAFTGTASNVPLNQWVWVGVRTTGPSKGLELLVNGVNAAFIQPPGAATGFDAGQGDLKIGPVSGVDIDDVRFYNTLPDPCLVATRGFLNLQGACVAGRPAGELDFEGGTLVQTGFMPYVVSNPLWTPFAGKLGEGFKIASPQVPLAMSEFAKFGEAPGGSGRSITLWTPGNSAADTMVDFTTNCIGPTFNGVCGIQVLYTANRQWQIFMGVPGTGVAQQQTTTVPTAPLDARTHNLVISEKRNGNITVSIRIYVDGVLADVRNFGNGDVFGQTNNIFRSVSNAGSIDELEVWPMDLASDSEMLCENGFDGQWNPATDSCSFTSN